MFGIIDKFPMEKIIDIFNYNWYIEFKDNFDVQEGRCLMFQLKLSIQLENNRLPGELERPVVSFLKASIQKESHELYEKLFCSKKAVLKSYCFSYYLPQAVFEKRAIYLGNPEFTIFFSDADMEELLHFYNGFLKMRFVKYPLNGNSMCLTHVAIVPLKEIREDHIIVKMLSPLLVREHDRENNKDRYCLFDEDNFSDVLKENTGYFMEQMGYGFSMEGFSIKPVKAKKVVVPAFGKLVDGNLGVYQLAGPPGLLNILLSAGIGSRRSEGRGKFQVIL